MKAGRKTVVALLVVAVAVVVVVFLIARRDAGLPAPGSSAYADVTRAFYRGLAELEVGLLDAARADFTRATAIVPEEPASWANLGITHLRLGDLDAAVAPIEQAVALAPQRAEMALLVARMEMTRGRTEDAITALRRAVALDPGSLRARFALAEELERAGGPDADAEVQQSFDDLLAAAPDNLALLVEAARLAASRGDAARLDAAVTRLEMVSATWTDAAREQLAMLRASADAGDFVGAARASAFVRNLLAPLPAFQEDLAAVRTPAELIADPFDRFLTLAPVVSAPSPADAALTHTGEPLAAPRTPAWQMLAMLPRDDQPPIVVATDGVDVIRLDDGARLAAFPSGQPAAGPGLGRRGMSGLLALDWNNDFRMDLLLAGPGGVRLLLQNPDATFADVTADASGETVPAACDCTGAWAADIEMEGDLDIVLGVVAGPPVVLRNNGDGTWLPTQPFGDIGGVRDFAWADVDRDGDPDAVLLDAAGGVHVLANRQAGQFAATPQTPSGGPVVALSAGDPDANGALDVVMLAADGAVTRASYAGGQWDAAPLVRWESMPAGPVPGEFRIVLADLDNSGGIDIVVSGSGRSAAWVTDETGGYAAYAGVPDAEIFGAADLTADGLLDLVGLSDGAPTRFVAEGQQDYRWQRVRPRAQQIAGDQRINSFGVGGEVEVRAGLFTQKQILTGAPLHFGLGAHDALDLVRIVWPNGVMQAEFDPAVNQAIVAEQRLKGSCPWLFTFDGEEMRFVTDFLWRSPLGLRINAQDTAGITQTEDRVKIRGDQLVPRDGVYDVRITAELWETHYLDHVSLLVVDHPADTEIFVDERFFAPAPPALDVRAFRPLVPIARAIDHLGRDMTAVVAAQDGQYLASLERGAYQGVAREHFVDVELQEPVTASRPRWLIAHGWIYPTDSSINVAIAQGTQASPRGLSLEALDDSGRWVVVTADLGFPAGKNKTILIDLSAAARAGIERAQRFRLRTNLEIYWDSFAVGERIDPAIVRTERLLPDRAELRFRGFSETEYDTREVPETPDYGRLAGTTQRWRDLVGYYTRFGDVRELTAVVDDRYVIMNAGDELVFEFPVPAGPPEGWRRDFVLIGDGWEKDGDFNTGFSRTVGPLPSHDRPEYDGPMELEEDPVYIRHRRDWEEYHTRYVTPHAFLRGLWSR